LKERETVKEHFKNWGKMEKKRKNAKGQSDDKKQCLDYIQKNKHPPNKNPPPQKEENPPKNKTPPTPAKNTPQTKQTPKKKKTGEKNR